MKHKPIIPKTYPPDDRENWYSTFDVMKIFGWKRGLLKNWIEQGFIKGAGFSHDNRGQLVFFAGFQLYTLRLFKCLIDIGLSRAHAGAWSRRIENDVLKKGDIDISDVAFILVEIKGGQVASIHFPQVPTEITIKYRDDSNDYYVVNFKKLIREVDAIT